MTRTQKALITAVDDMVKKELEAKTSDRQLIYKLMKILPEVKELFQALPPGDGEYHFEEHDGFTYLRSMLDIIATGKMLHPYTVAEH
jgi:hypothetical protein